MKFRVRYRRARVTVDGFKPLECRACSGEGRIELHHFHYEFTTAEVRKDPQLALLNSVWLCYKCHRIADHIRNLMKDPKRTLTVIKVLKSKGGLWQEMNTSALFAGSS